MAEVKVDVTDDVTVAGEVALGVGDDVGADDDVDDELGVDEDVDDDVTVSVDVALGVLAAAAWHMYDACTCALTEDTLRELLLMDGQYRRAKPPLSCVASTCSRPVVRAASVPDDAPGPKLDSVPTGKTRRPTHAST